MPDTCVRGDTATVVTYYSTVFRYSAGKAIAIKEAKRQTILPAYDSRVLRTPSTCSVP